MDHDESVNVRATLRYVGTNFSGWQVQPGKRTVQGEIERALAQIASHPVRIHGAGRTDAGVHAFGQVCSFRWTRNHDLEKLRRALTSMLAPEVSMTAIASVPDDFHARKSALGKHYWYTFSTAPEADPFLAPFAWTIPRNVDLAVMRDLCARIEGTHDFGGFQGSGSSVENTVRTLYSVEVNSGASMTPVDAHDVYRIEFHGNGFLYKMIRNIMGTFIDVARGHLPEARIEEVLKAPSPYRGFTAPAHGLTLVSVQYRP